MCIRTCDLLLRVGGWCIHRLSSSGAYQSDSLPPHFMIKTTALEQGDVCAPGLHKLPPLGFRCLWKSLGALLIALRIRNVPAQIIHTDNWNKNITLYIRSTATPRTKLTVYKNSYVKNLQKRQTQRKSSVQTFTEKKKSNQTQHGPIIMAAKTCYCLQFHFIVWLEIILWHPVTAW